MRKGCNRGMGKLCDRWETGGVVSHREGPHHWNDLEQGSVSKAAKAPRASGVPVELCSLSFSWLRAMLERKDTGWERGREGAPIARPVSVRALQRTNALQKHTWLKLPLSRIQYASYVTVQLFKKIHTYYIARIAFH